MDREKAIEAFADYEPYSHDLPCVTIKSEVYRNALAMLKEQDELLRKKQKDIDRLCNEMSEWKHKFHDTLKEQEAVVPNRGLAKTQTAWFCGACGFRLNRAGRYCSKCGKEVKWR